MSGLTPAVDPAMQEFLEFQQFRRMQQQFAQHPQQQQQLLSSPAPPTPTPASRMGPRAIPKPVQTRPSTTATGIGKDTTTRLPSPPPFLPPPLRSRPGAFTALPTGTIALVPPPPPPWSRILDSSVHAAGLNLHTAYHVGIGFSYVWNQNTILQYMGRLYRIGQQKLVEWYLVKEEVAKAIEPFDPARDNEDTDMEDDELEYITMDDGTYIC
ncbi:hypothetical protein QBC32DRAFT_342120 [Pseudoneurospora amorphoporcata]|uniref:Uncharacterized protein n=1 Tax=Pseudoneurospora amorphoporcata TaxID=241081 RepID=A0AAN6NUL9_9PEZI|nr:hypothetical protein QBC32DRAFT_342120 [Pseudoneurospora amorphoporcata]